MPWKSAFTISPSDSPVMSRTSSLCTPKCPTMLGAPISLGHGSSQVALGKFSLVQSQAIFARPETGQSSPRQKFWDRDQDCQGLSRSVWSRSRPSPDGPWWYIYSGACRRGERESWGVADGEVVGRCGLALNPSITSSTLFSKICCD